MATCRSIDPLVTPYVDGELPPADRDDVASHLRRCPPCQARVAAESAVRGLVRERRDALATERAPRELKTRCAAFAALAGSRTSSASARAAVPSSRPWRVAAAPFALAASLVILVSGAFLYQATDRSSRVLAAELAADHVKCFAANEVLGTQDSPADVESAMASSFNWRLHLPPQLRTEGFELVGARRCLYGEGKIAHLMYRQQGRPVSVFMLPRSSRPEELVEVLGHEAVIWSEGDRTFVLVSRGSAHDVEGMASVVRAALQ